MAESMTYSTKKLSGVRVVGGKSGDKRIGKVSRFVFHPREKRCVGFLVKRPDAALMFKRHDLFIPLDGFEIEDGRIVLPHHEKDMEGKGAIERLGLDWDHCVLWHSMPIITRSGEECGTVGDVVFKKASGKVVSVVAERGATAKALLGERVIPANMIVGFKLGLGAMPVSAGEAAEGQDDDQVLTGAILVSDDVLAVATEGGLAEKAGRGAASAAGRAQRAKDKAKPKVDEAIKATGDAINKGAYATGRQIGRARGMFGAFKDEYNKAMKDD